MVCCLEKRATARVSFSLYSQISKLMLVNDSRDKPGHRRLRFSFLYSIVKEPDG